MSADTRGIVLEPPRSGRTVGVAAHVGRPARLRHRIGRGAQGIRRAAGAKIAMHTEQNEPTSRTTCWNCCSNGLVRAQGLLRRGDIALDPFARFGATMLARN